MCTMWWRVVDGVQDRCRQWVLMQTREAATATRPDVYWLRFVEMLMHVEAS